MPFFVILYLNLQDQLEKAQLEKKDLKYAGVHKIRNDSRRSK